VQHKVVIFSEPSSLHSFPQETPVFVTYYRVIEKDGRDLKPL